jgi:hypothetical protein
MTRRILQVISWSACLATIVPALLYFVGALSLERMQAVMLIAAIVWFAVTPWWMGRRDGS